MVVQAALSVAVAGRLVLLLLMPMSCKRTMLSPISTSLLKMSRRSSGTM
jgi:hypothetical protein